MGAIFSSFGRYSATPSGFDSSSTAEQVTHGIDASHLTAIVTGASSGLGAETARVLALRGAHVIIAVRDIVAGERVKEKIVNDNKLARVHVLELDLSSIHSIQNFCKNFKAMNAPLNILINNAGIMGCSFQLSKDGIELQFATNHLGPFLLTNNLVDDMITTAKELNVEGRIVMVSSDAHHMSYPEGIRFEKLNEKKGYSPFVAYGHSKLANILFANELSRRLQEQGAKVTVNSLHPGVIRTNIIHHYQFLVFAARFEMFASFFLKTIPQGAATQCFLALHPFLNGISGKFFRNCNFSKRSDYARDPKLAMNLWEFSEKIIFASKQHQKMVEFDETSH